MRRIWILVVLMGASLLGPGSLGLAQGDDYGNTPSAFSATLLPEGNVEVKGTIETVGDVDCFMFEALRTASYTLETVELDDTLDTLLVLFDRNGRTVLAVDDNGGQDRGSKIEFTPTFDGLYFVCVRNARATQGTGGYTLRLTSGQASAPATQVTPPDPSPPQEPEGQAPETSNPPAPPEPQPPVSPPEPTRPPQGPANEVLREGRVVLLGGDDDASIANVQSYLTATGAFAEVAVINVAQRTPSAADLNRYEAALVWADSGFLDADALGNLLADYADRGGGVVVAAVSFDVPDPFDPDTLGGRFLADGYYVIEPSVDNVSNGRRVLGAVSAPDHPVMRNVRKIDGGPSSLHSPTTRLTPGGAVLASWDSGDVLVAAKTLGSANRVDVNLFPPSSLLNPDLWPFTPDNDVPQLMANALLWVAGREGPFNPAPQGSPARLELNPTAVQFSARRGQTTPPDQTITLRNDGGLPLRWSASADVAWLRVSPAQGELQAGQSATLSIGISPESLEPGTHSGAVTVSAPGAENGTLRISVTLTLAAAEGGTPTPPTPPTPPVGNGNLIRVPQDAATLTAALGKALPGDTVELAGGSYPDVALTLNQALTLRAAVGQTVVLRGNGRDPVVTVGSSGLVTLSHLTLSTGGTGLVFGDGASVTLQDSVVQTNVGWGVRALGAAQVTITNTTIANNNAGGITIDIDGATNTRSQITMNGNTIVDNNGCGLHVASDEPGISISGSNNRIADNSFDICDNGNKVPGGFADAADSDAVSEAKKFDSDGDGVPDSVDFCPLTPGRKDNNGCP